MRNPSLVPIVPWLFEGNLIIMYCIVHHVMTEFLCPPPIVSRRVGLVSFFVPLAQLHPDICHLSPQRLAGGRTWAAAAHQSWLAASPCCFRSPGSY